jgi:hypothetical protein
MSRPKYFVLLMIVFTALGLEGCGGGDDDTPPAPAPATFTVGGNVSGLSGSVVLRLNGANDLTVNASGTFAFSNQLGSGTAYTVTVQTQPATQTCVVTNGSGNVTANVTNVAVACTSNTFTIGGALSGLNGTVVLQNNGGNDLSLTADGNFAFSTAVNSGAAYSVTVLTQPVGQTCAVTNGSGNANANVTNVAVNCMNTAPVTIGGTVTGLTAGAVVLQNNLGDNLVVTTSPFTFPTPVAANSAYFVTVLGHPVGLTCQVTANGSGVSATNVTDVGVSCAANTAATVTVGGTVSGLVGAGPFTLRNVFNDLVGGGPVTQDIQITSNGPFTFPAIPSRSIFVITALTQPAGQTCSVFANTGLPVADVTSVVVDCSNGTTVYTVGGTVSGLTRAGLILTINANNGVLVVPSGATQFTFPNGLVPGTEYFVGIGVQPPGMTCIVTDGSDRVIAANSTSVAVTCIDNATDPLFGTYEILGQDNFITLYPDGTYLLASRENDAGCGLSNGNGIELGVYNYDDGTGAFSVVSNTIDTNGDCGLWDGTGLSGTVQKTGVGQGSSITFDDGSDTFTLEPVPSVANTFLGSFRQPGGPDFLVLENDGHYTVTHSTNDSAGIEYGCYTLTGTTSGNFTPDVTPGTCAGTVDTNDDAGFSDADGTPLPYTVVNPYVVVAFERVFVRIVPN